MEKSKILKLGWGIFGLSFLLGNSCLFGYLGTEDIGFAVSGYFLLIGASAINLIALFVFIILGSTDKENEKYWFQSAGILLLNIPIALLYAYIGLEMI